MRQEGRAYIFAILFQSRADPSRHVDPRCPPEPPALDLVVSGDVIIEAGGLIAANARGFPAGEGPEPGGVAPAASTAVGAATVVEAATAPIRVRPAAAAFPVKQAGRLPHYPFRGLLSVHSHYGLHARQVAYSDPLHRRLQQFC